MTEEPSGTAMREQLFFTIHGVLSSAPDAYERGGVGLWLYLHALTTEELQDAWGRVFPLE